LENIDFKEYFISLLKKSEIKVKNEKIEKMMEFLELLYKKNQVMNLTAIRDKKGMLEKHFVDSLFLTKVINDTEKSFIDVGTGAGFPGLVLAIYYPEKNFLLVDSVRKKIDFINEVIKELNLKNVNTSFERSEELIKNNREIYDIALCRGVANLRIILEYMIPFIKVNGRFLPQKLNLNEIDVLFTQSCAANKFKDFFVAVSDSVAPNARRIEGVYLHPFVYLLFASQDGETTPFVSLVRLKDIYKSLDYEIVVQRLDEEGNLREIYAYNSLGMVGAAQKLQETLQDYAETGVLWSCEKRFLFPTVSSERLKRHARKIGKKPEIIS